MTEVLVAFGTRPEAIKLAPLIHELRQRSSFRVHVCVTGQHREMLEQVLRLFGIVPDVDLNLMKSDQDLAEIAAAIVRGVGAVIRARRPALVVVQGDTTSAFAAGLAAFYAGVDVAHVEAGLRSGDHAAPWPEEVQRKLLTVLARHHFAPTEDARENLLREGVHPSSIHVTGNTVVDALILTRTRILGDDALRVRMAEALSLGEGHRMILVTGHRRESFGPGLASICDALVRIAREHEDVEIVYPVHLNPNVLGPVQNILSGITRIHLIEPVDYDGFVHLMMRSELILTDSGGVQEEASTLGKPVLVMRDTTERPEAVREGNMRMVGTDAGTIVAEVKRLLQDAGHRASMSKPTRVFGDGKASERIAQILLGLG